MELVTSDASLKIDRLRVYRDEPEWNVYAFLSGDLFKLKFEIILNKSFLINRTSKPDKNSEELQTADAQVERFKDVLEKIGKKFTPNAGGLGGIGGGGSIELPLDAASREKRCKKVHEHRLAQAMEESLMNLPDGLLRDVLENCGALIIRR